MRTHIFRTIALLALVALGPGLGSRLDATATDETPGMTVWGQVYINGEVAPAGTEVQVTFGDTVCATTSVTEGKSFITGAPTTVYSVDLPARASGPCGGPDQWLNLSVDGQNGGASVEWEAGARLRQNVIVGTGVFDPMYSPFDLLSAAIVGGERLGGEGNVTIRAGGIGCVTVKAVPIGHGVTAIEDVPIWANSLSMPDGCALMSAPLEFFRDGKKLEVLLGWTTFGLFGANGEHFLILGANPGGMLIDGRLLIDGEPAPAGTKIEAVVDGVVCGEDVLQAVSPSLYPYAGSGTFVMPVGGTAGAKARCTEGAEMRFRVGDDWANETVEIASSGVVRTRLTVGDSDFIPIGGEVTGDGGGLPLSGTLTVMKDGVECGRAPVTQNEFGKHLFTDLIARCGTQDVREMQFFLNRRPLSVTYAGEPVPGVVSPAGIQYVTLSDASGAMFLDGEVFVDGRVAQGGTRLQAFVGDAVCGETSVQLPGDKSELFRQEEGHYWLPVDSDLRRAGCGVEGSEVTFRIDGRQANETISWRAGSGDPEDLRLTVGMKQMAVYYGDAPSPAEEGIVHAFIDGRECGSAAYFANAYGRRAFTNLVVPSENDVPGCGRPGAVVEFTVDDLREGERVESFDGPVLWMPSNRDQELDLRLEVPVRYGVVVDGFQPVSSPNTGAGATDAVNESRMLTFALDLLTLGSMLLVAGSLCAWSVRGARR